MTQLLGGRFLFTRSPSERILGHLLLRRMAHIASDFPAQLGLKAGSAAQLLEASGLSNSKPEPVFQASEGLGLSRPANPGFPA